MAEFYQVDFDRDDPRREQWEKLNFCLRRLFNRLGETDVTTAANEAADIKVHSGLSGLSYAASGHTGFAPSSHTHAPADITPQGAGSGLDADTVDGKHYTDINPMTTLGDMIYGGASGVPTRLAPGSANTVLRAGTPPSWGQVVENDISLSDVATNNTDTTKHGFAPKLSGVAGQFLSGLGNWATPAGITGTYTTQTFTSVTSVNVIHNFGTYPVVQVIDGSGNLLIPLTVVHNSVNDFTVTFAVSSTGTVLVTLGSPQAQSIKTVTTDYTILASDRILKVTTAGVTLTLPTAVGNTGREYIIDNASSSYIYLDGDGTETIEDELLQTIPKNAAIHVYSDGANWRIY